jgi:multidrug efflux pump subunit AcrA (membrane-fusion protein)
MHPDYVVNKPGSCPICGMPLILILEKEPASGIREERVLVNLNQEQERVLGLSVSEVKEKQIKKVLRAVGKVSMAAPSRILSPCDGTVERIEQNPGSSGALRVLAGEKILSIAALGGSVPIRAATPLVLLTVPPSGSPVAEGKELCTFVDLATIFVLADVKSADIPFLHSGTGAKATLPNFPGKVWQGTIAAGSQQFDERSQTLKVRFQFQNDQPWIWQGMMANLEVECPIGMVLAVPESAVIEDGENTLVFVERSPHLFEPRPIAIGFHDQSLVEVKEGLSKGERVVTSATFLLDSESRLRALAQAADRP